MMLNEIITTANSGDMRSGIGKSQSFRDGPVLGVLPLSVETDSAQQNFLTVLSQFNNKTVNVRNDESNDTDPEAAQEKLPDGVTADNAAPEKPAETVPKEGNGAKLLSPVYPDAIGLILGLLSQPDRLKPDCLISDISAEATLPSPDREKAENSDFSLNTEMSKPEMQPNQAVLPSVPQDMNPDAASTMGSGFPGIYPDQTAHGRKIPAPEKGNSGSGLISDLRHTSPEQMTSVKADQANKPPESVLFGSSGMVLAASTDDGAGPEWSQNIGSGQLRSPGQGQPDTGLISENADARPEQMTSVKADQAKNPPERVSSGSSDIVSSASTADGEIQSGFSKNPQDASQRTAFPAPDRNHLGSLTDKENPDAGRIMTRLNAAGRDARKSSGRDQAAGVHDIKEASAAFEQIDAAGEDVDIAVTEANASGADSAGKMDAFASQAALNEFSGSDGEPRVQAREPGSGEPVAHFARQAQAEKTFPVNPSSNEIRSADPPYQTEVIRQVVDKSAATLKSGQSEIQIDLKPESLGHLRLHVSMEHEHVTVKILAENTQVKEMIERQAYLIKNELQSQGIKVDTVNVDMLMSGGSDFASADHEEAAFNQGRNTTAHDMEPEKSIETRTKAPDPPRQTNSGGRYLVNYFA